MGRQLIYTGEKLNKVDIMASLKVLTIDDDNEMTTKIQIKNKNPAAVALGKLGGQAGKGKPKSRPEGYYSHIAKLPRKRKSAKL